MSTVAHRLDATRKTLNEAQTVRILNPPFLRSSFTGQNCWWFLLTLVIQALRTFWVSVESGARRTPGLRRRESSVLAVAFILGSLSIPPAAAGDVHYLVFLDESGAAGGAFYIGVGFPGRDAKDCPQVPESAQLRKCSLAYALNADGVPTATYPLDHLDKNGKVGRQITTGDVLLLESDAKSSVQSDVIQFKDLGHGRNGGADSILFYSAADDAKDTDGSKDVTLPSNNADAKHTFHELSLANTDLIPTIETMAIPAKAQRDLFAGRSGYLYTAGQKDPGGLAATAAEGFVGYVFYSDMDQVISKGKSVHFDSAASLLSFSNDSVIDTGSAGDPLVGADVDMPDFQLQGMTPQGQELFTPLAGGMMTLSSGTCTSMRATVSSMTYDPSANLFSATLSGTFVGGADPASPLYDPNLNCIDSDFLHYLDSVFNPNSIMFNPASSLTITYQPDNNFFAQTFGFSTSAESAITNIISVSPVEEPSMVFPVCVALVALVRMKPTSCLFSRSQPNGKRARE
jgi:hypothetical protein